jgi:O-antigen ligase
MAQSVKLRPMLAMVAWKIVGDHPFFGCGFGQYKKVDRNYVYDHDVDMPLEVARRYVQHNVFLSLIAETGFVGITAYLALLSGWLHRAWRVWRDDRLPLTLRQHGLLYCAFCASWLANGLFHDTNLMMNSNLIAFLLAGLSQGIYARARATAPEAVSRSTVNPASPPVAWVLQRRMET